MTTRSAISRRRVTALALIASLAAAASSKAEPSKVARVGVLLTGNAQGQPIPLAIRGIAQLESQMRELGWIKGENVSYDFRFARTNDELPALTKELVDDSVDVIFTTGTPAGLAAKEATSKSGTPVVFVSVGDPVGVGLVSSLSQPGGNVTGISGITYQLGAKRLELMREVLPDARLFAMLLDPEDKTAAQVFDALKKGLGSTPVAVESFRAGRAADIAPAFEAMKRRGVDAVLIQPDGLFAAQRGTIVKLAAELRLPAMFAFPDDVVAGGLMGYGADWLDMVKQAVPYIDKILKGVRPSELPVQEPTKLYLSINLKTARALGLTIPQRLMISADHIVE